MTSSISFRKFNDSPFIAESDNKKSIESFDTIEVKNFADSIAEFIVTCETPMTIGLQGDWGTGKTSLMNMIKCYLPEERNHKIDINTWHYSMFRQDEYLGIIIIKSLLDQLSNKFNTKDNNLSSSFKKLGKVLEVGLQKAINVAKVVQVGGITYKDAKEAVEGEDNSIQIENLSALLLQFKKEFQSIIKQNVVDKNERIFFFVDDLDRIRPIKAIEVLETLKNFMDVEGCVFILAVDYEIVQMGIAEKFGKDIQRTSGKSFFDKIIQLPFTMPTSSYNIEGYISDLLKDSKFYNYKIENNEEDRVFFVDITEVTIGRNPRSIKRAINYASLLERIRAKNSTKESKKDRTTTKLLYAIVCMQIAWPELFEYFVINPSPDTIKNLENWDYLDKLPQAKKLFARVSNVDEVKDNISAFFDTLYAILDTEEKDGIITDKELEPLLDVLKYVKLTSQKNIVKSEDPLRKLFKRILDQNASKNVQMHTFFNEVFLNSQFAISDNINYKKGGWSYVTMVSNRKQLGSLVSLKTRPFILRLKASKELIINPYSDKPEFEILSKIVRDLENANAVTGIGDTEVDCLELASNYDVKTAKEVLNKIFKSITSNNV